MSPNIVPPREISPRRGGPLWRIVLAVVLSNALGNFALSLGMKQPAPSLLASLFNPYVLAGIALLIFWTLIRMHLLSLADLSFVLPVTALGYALNALMGAAFLGETITASRWAGTLFIMAGTALAGATLPRTPRP